MAAILSRPHCVNSLWLEQNGWHFGDNIFKCIFLNENCCIAIKISPKFFPKGPIDKKPSLVHMMASHYLNQWRPSLMTHICVTQPQCVNQPLLVWFHFMNKKICLHFISFEINFSVWHKWLKPLWIWDKDPFILHNWLIGPWGIFLQSRLSKFQTHLSDKYIKNFLWNCYQVNVTTPHWSLVNIGSGNGLVPSGNKPLPEPMLT